MKAITIVESYSNDCYFNMERLYLGSGDLVAKGLNCHRPHNRSINKVVRPDLIRFNSRKSSTRSVYVVKVASYLKLRVIVDTFFYLLNR